MSIDLETMASRNTNICALYIVLSLVHLFNDLPGQKVCKQLGQYQLRQGVPILYGH